MTNENTDSQPAIDPSAEVESNTQDAVLDWEKKYHEEVKQSKSYRQRAQDAESNLDKYNKKQESSRKKKLEEEVNCSRL